MARVKTLCLAALTLTVISAVQASAASATETSLPSILFLPGTTSGELKASCKAAGCKSSFTGIRNLSGTGYLFQFFAATDMAELGEAEVLLEGIGIVGTETKCNTAGDAAGVMLIDKAEWHFALDLSGHLLILVLLPGTVTIECGALKIKIKGSEMYSLSPFASEVAAGGKFEASTGKCTGRKPAFTEYDNMAGTMSSVKLESSVGLGFEESCEEIEGKIQLTSSTMAEVMEP
jgi:hypothetical protein